MALTITYRGPKVLAGAFAHLLREEGAAFDQPREDRTDLAEVAVLVLDVRAGDVAPDRTLDEVVDAAVARFQKRFGTDAASIEVAPGEGETDESGASS